MKYIHFLFVNAEISVVNIFYSAKFMLHLLLTWTNVSVASYNHHHHPRVTMILPHHCPRLETMIMPPLSAKEDSLAQLFIEGIRCSRLP